MHSIKKRPTVKGNKRRTPKQKAYLARKEFNPFLYRAWLLMAEAQFRKGEFIEAASTYNYILRLYSTQPEVVGPAKAGLARCYVALDWPYDAEDILNKMKRDTITPRGAKERDKTSAAYYLLTDQPASSYQLDRDANKQYTLRITNPQEFWSTSKYLVVLVK